MENQEKANAVEDENKRSSMFTVRNAENAMIIFCIFSFSLLVLVYMHGVLIKGTGWVDAFYAVAFNISKIMAASTMLTIFEEGIDIMLFQRIRDTLKREKKFIAEAKDAVHKEIAKEIAEGIAKGKAEVYREIAEWDRRRKEAEARGEEFTEPPPTQPQE